jgi:signal transduction histidine kinase
MPVTTLGGRRRSTGWSKALVEAQRGRIWLAPRDGGGLEVSFTLPVQPAPFAGGADDD